MAYTVAVVPIFVNAGAALAPALLAGVVAVVGVLLRPRELVALFRRRPLVPVIGAVAVAGTWWAVGALMGAGTPERPGTAGTDWVKVATDIIHRQRLAALSTQPVVEVQPAKRDRPIVFRYDYTRCGYDGSAAPVGLQPGWQYKDPEEAMALSSPLVAGGRVYATVSYDNVDARIYGEVVCLDAGEGSLLWRTEEPLKGFFSSPALSQDGKYLLIGQGLHEDQDCELLCLEAATGKFHWRIKTSLHIEGSPAVHGDMVVAGAGAIEGPDRKPRTGPGEVIAVRISDGQELWRCQVNDPESSPAISSDGIVYIGSGFQGNAVVALRSETDAELRAKGLERVLWRTSLPYPVTGPVTLAGDLVIVGAGNSDFVYAAPNPAGIVAALDARTGQVKWRIHLTDAVLGPVAFRDGKLICPVRSGQVVAMKAADGGEIWRTSISGKAPVLAGVAWAGEWIYAVSYDGYLAVLDAREGHVVERHALNAPGKPGTRGLSFSSPMVAAGRVYVGSETGGLRCFVGGKAGQ